jgi:molybdopterin-guanine dinucleotide biosynthesis protein
MSKTLKHELQTILSGKSQVGHGTLIQTIASYLRRSQATSAMVKGNEHKKQGTDIENKYTKTITIS